MAIARSDVAVRLEAARLRAGLGVAELAASCGLEARVVGDILAGRARLDGRIARELVDRLELDSATADLVIHLAEDDAGSPEATIMLWGDFGDRPDLP